jgi:microcin C transport system ATP-binding protein
MTNNAPAPLITISHLCVTFRTPVGGTQTAVHDLSFDIQRGETLALVGESGSGKSVTALSILQLLPYPAAAHDPDSRIQFDGVNMIGADPAKLRTLRGRRIGMIFQEPLTSLNPLHTLEQQIAEAITLHQSLPRDKVKARVLELLDQVELEGLCDRLNAYPHELSGGQRQRVMIAIALANNPDLLIADEPTTALDVTVQAQILKLLDDLKRKNNMALLLISHDLSVVRKMADRVGVMRHGELVELATTENLFNNPQHAYTKQLLDAHPRGLPEPAPDGAPTVLSADNVKVWFPRGKTWWGKPTGYVKAVDGLSCTLRAGHTLGIVGESGSGKTTFALALLRLTTSTGPIVFQGDRIDNLPRAALRPLRAKLQIVFQDPFGSLSPRMSISEIIGEGLLVHQPNLSRTDREARIIRALNQVQLDPETRHRYPHEFSGGQRQRVAIARALVLEPSVIVLDEPTSALDVSIQAQIVELLKKLQHDLGLAYIFISHDLRVVRALAHDMIVMKDGVMVEQGKANDLFNNPQDPYTRALLDAALNLKAA